eukprot:1184728-Prorocentrum_minimum.AAC.2
MQCYTATHRAILLIYSKVAHPQKGRAVGEKVRNWTQSEKRGWVSGVLCAHPCRYWHRSEAAHLEEVLLVSEGEVALEGVVVFVPVQDAVPRRRPQVQHHPHALAPAHLHRRGYILTMDQSDARSVMHEAQAYSHNGPIRRRKHGYILTMDQSGHQVLTAGANFASTRSRLLHATAHTTVDAAARASPSTSAPACAPIARRHNVKSAKRELIGRLYQPMHLMLACLPVHYVHPLYSLEGAWRGSRGAYHAGLAHAQHERVVVGEHEHAALPEGDVLLISVDRELALSAPDVQPAPEVRAPLGQPQHLQRTRQKPFRPPLDPLIHKLVGTQRCRRVVSHLLA